MLDSNSHPHSVSDNSPEAESLETDSQVKRLSWLDHPASLFEIGTFELWYQPVYQMETGAVLSNEVLLRWRDETGKLYLPREFIPPLAEAGLLSRVDALVIQKALQALQKDPQLQLSVNLSPDSFHNWALLDQIKAELATQEIEPTRLSFEVSENAIAQDFAQALKFLEALKAIGCPIILDNFASRDLSLAECEELPIDSIKLDEKFLHRFTEDPKSQAFAKATLSFCQSLGQVTAKFVTDESTLKLVQEAGLNAIQGNHLRKATNTPEHQAWLQKTEAKTGTIANPTPKTPSPSLPPASENPTNLEPPKLWRRLLVGTAFIGLGIVAVSIGAVTLGHRASRIIVESGIVNGRVLRLRSPIDGTVEAFYPRPGVPVEAGQVLLQLGRSQDTEQALLQLQGELQSRENQLQAARKSLDFLQSRLSKQESEYERLWDVENEINARDTNQKEAALDKAEAEAEAARLDYERFRQLRAEGAIAQQIVDQARSAWQVAQAEVRRAREDLSATNTALRASQERIAMNRYPNWGDSFVEETTQLRQQIQDQTILINTLTAEVQIAQERLRQAQSQYSDDQELEVESPLNAIVYSTEREQGEAVSQSEELLTLLDCNELWAEAVVSAEEAARIDPQAPILVELAQYKQPVTGEIDLIQAVSPLGDAERSKRLQVQALVPSIEPDLVGKSLSRVKVTIPPPPTYEQTEQFCGLGQPARLTFATRSQTWRERLTELSPPWLRELFS